MKFIIKPHRPTYINNPWATKKSEARPVEEVIKDYLKKQASEDQLELRGVRDLLKEITLTNSPSWVKF